MTMKNLELQTMVKALLEQAGIRVHADMRGPTDLYIGNDGNPFEAPAIMHRCQVDSSVGEMYINSDDPKLFAAMFLRDQILIDMEKSQTKAKGHNIAIRSVDFLYREDDPTSYIARYANW